MKQKFTSTVAGATIFITITGLLSKGLGFFREIIFASSFGLSSNFDIYLVAAVLPLTLNTVILYLAQNYLIPIYTKSRTSEVKESEDFISYNYFIFIAGGLLLSILLFFFSEQIIKFYFQSSNTEVTETASLIFKLFLISIPINASNSVLIASQQVHFEFKSPAYSQLILNFSFIALVIVFANSLAIYVIPLGYNVGLLLQMFYLLKKNNIKLITFKFFHIVRNTKMFFPSTLLFIIFIESIGQLYIVADRYFYSYVPVGGIASLNYAQTIFLLPLSIISIALTTAIFPRFSQCINNNSFQELENVFNESIKINIAIFIPVTFLFITYGDFIIKIFFQRGKFSITDTLITFKALEFLSVSLVFYAIYSVLNKLLYSLGMIKHLLYITITGIFLKILLNYLFVRNLYQYGLALSSSISYLFFFSASMFLIYKRIIIRNKKLFINELFFHLTNGIICIFIIREISVLIPIKALLLEMILFLVIYSLNIFYTEHSLTYIFRRLFILLTEKWRVSGKPGYD